MCTFNGGRFLPAQLQSIADQSRPPDEMVICDDSSSDGSDSIIAEFARRVTFPVHVMRNHRTLGSTRNFEQAISFCRESIIALADQDDVWHVNKLKRIEEALQGQRQPVAAFSDADVIDENSRKSRHRLWQSFFFGRREQKRFEHGEALKILTRHPVVTGATMAFRREFVPLLLPIPANHVRDAWISFLLAACGDFAIIPEPLMQYRRHSRQQIGPGRMTLRDRLKQACSTGPQFYLEEIKRFEQFSERIESRRSEFCHAERALKEIENKISHRQHRAQLPRASVARIPRVLREMVNGGYWRYSEGWESVAKDMAGLFANRNSAGSR